MHFDFVVAVTYALQSITLIYNTGIFSRYRRVSVSGIKFDFIRIYLLREITYIPWHCMITLKRRMFSVTRPPGQSTTRETVHAFRFSFCLPSSAGAKFHCIAVDQTTELLLCYFTLLVSGATWIYHDPGISTQCDCKLPVLLLGAFFILFYLCIFLSTLHYTTISSWKRVPKGP